MEGDFDSVTPITNINTFEETRYHHRIRTSGWLLQLLEVFHETLPEVVATYQPEIRYWRSSPTSDDDTLSPQDIHVGDVHYWGYRAKRLPISEFKAKENIPRFMSETGFQSFPELESVKNSLYHQIGNYFLL